MTRNRIEIIFLIVAMVWPTAAAWLYFVAADPHHGLVPVLYSTGKVVQFAMPLVCWALTDPTRFRFPWPTKRGLGSGAGFGLLVVAAILTLFFAVLKDSPLLSGVDEQ